MSTRASVYYSDSARIHLYRDVLDNCLYLSIDGPGSSEFKDGKWTDGWEEACVCFEDSKAEDEFEKMCFEYLRQKGYRI